MRPEITVPSFSVSEFVALVNQTFDIAYPSLTVTGELANLRVSKNKWVYFDLKDDGASVKFFGTIYNLPGPLEDGMLLEVRGAPRLHPLYGFSVTVQAIRPTGAGTIRRAAELLQAQLAAEGLFDEARKRPLPYPPQRIGLVASAQSAAYADFIKILGARWGGLEVHHIDVQVQGEASPAQIVAAIEHFNGLAEPPEILVLIRGGGSPEDLAAFSTVIVTRAVAASRVPTLVAIGHEVDTSLAELAADRRASTPSNAAELLVPDRAVAVDQLRDATEHLANYGQSILRGARQQLADDSIDLQETVKHCLEYANLKLESQHKLLAALSPAAILRRGYAIIRQNGRLVRRTSDIQRKGQLTIQLADESLQVQPLPAEGK